MTTATKKPWKIEGYDAFEGGDAFYPLPGEFATEDAAKSAARDRLAELNKRQPVSSSGGQDSTGIQDGVYIVDPTGKRHRFIG